MHRARYTGRIYLKNGLLMLEETAHFKKFHEVVYRESEDGKAWSRYMYFTAMAGYLLSIPGDRLGYYFDYGLQEEEKLTRCAPYNAFHYDCWEDADNLEQLAKKDKTLWHFIQKMGFIGSPIYAFHQLVNYRKNPMAEMLIEAGQPELALSKQIYKLKGATKQKVIDYIKKQKVRMTYSTMMKCITLGIDYDNSVSYLYYRLSNKEMKYIRKKAINLYEYKDIKKMANYLHKEGDYWFFPSDPTRIHAELLKEYNNQLDLKQKAREENERKEKIKSYNAFERVVKAFPEVIDEDPWKVYVPQKISEVIRQADSLHQCLIALNYPKKVIQKQSVLVFISKNGQPSSTFETDYQMTEIKQFYANEKDRTNCQPTEYERTLAHKYMQLFA